MNAGPGEGAHRGEGLGNQFLANIRETDAIVNVVRIPRGQVWAMRGRCALLAAIGSAPQSLLDP